MADRDSDLFAGHFRCNSGQLVRGPNESAPLRSEERLRRVIPVGSQVHSRLLNISRIQTHGFLTARTWLQDNL